MKILKSGKLYVTEMYNGAVADICQASLIRRQICDECGCEYEYEQADVQSRVYVGGEGAKECGDYGYIHYVRCPECGARVACGCTSRKDFPEIIDEKFFDKWAEKVERD